MSKMIDLTGKQFGEWTVISLNKTEKRNKEYQTFWNCRCSCGTEKPVNGRNLRSGKSTNCGCVRKKKCSKILSELNGKYNEYYFTGEIGHGKFFNSIHEFLFDKEDYDKIKDICWIEMNGYVRGKIKGTKKAVFLHRYILSNAQVVDHRDRNPLNCCKSNLLSTTQCVNSQNQKLPITNKSGCVGVRWLSRIEKWYATLIYKKKRYYIGVFTDKEEAIIARLTKEVEICDDLFHRTNTPLLKKYGFI